ncbi:helix-turn-helix domain-containing protein [Kurthia massiliensis]|uniref:helix-turn-helix domain-containing protein n=1 Tax=Kurthia massiliensis TaxID=1033739 RepID=UPI0002894927|nr:helix-turn-helix domain-containing protein [Kurthia massiliensis]
MTTKKLEHISQLIYNNFNIPLFIFDIGSQKVQRIGHYIQSPMFDSVESFITKLLPSDNQQKVPLIHITNYLETFILLNTSPKEWAIIGPFTNFQMTEDSIDRLIRDYNIPLSYQQDLYEYYNQLKLLNQKQIVSLCSLLYFLIYQEPLDTEQVRNQILEIMDLEKIHIEQTIRDNRLGNALHLDHQIEQKIWQYVKEGKKEKLLEHLESIDMDSLGVLSKKSHLRNMKNQVIIYIALATRAAIEGGLYPEIAYSMNDISIQKVEETDDLQKIFYIGDGLLFALIDRMNENKVSIHSKSVNMCKNYIFNHIFEHITIQELADLVHLNPVYLSQLFKKETGKPLGKYIQEMKLKEAEQLLVQTNHSIADICMMLQFNSQSHFTSLFKQFTGVTPKQYRKKPPIHS